MNHKSESESGLLPIRIVNEQIVVDSRIIAEELGNEHRALTQLLKTHLAVIEKDFGRVAFEMLPLQTKGGVQRTNIALLNEGQATFLVTLSKNSPEAVFLKSKLVKSFLFYRNAFHSQETSQRLTVLESGLATLMEAITKITEVVTAKQLQLPKTEFKPDVIDVRTKKFDFITVYGYNVRHVVVDDKDWYSINDLSTGMKVRTTSFQIAKQLYKAGGKTMTCKIWLYGNTHPAWFCSKAGLNIITSGSRKLKLQDSTMNGGAL